MGQYPDPVVAAIAAAEASPPHRDGVPYWCQDPDGSGLMCSARTDERFVSCTKYTVAAEIPAKGAALGVVVVWKLADRCVYDDDGNLVSRNIKPYWVFAWRGPGPRDICGYCGADNGEAGELRWGYDCGNCGGN